jgi:hypothetical protein
MQVEDNTDALTEAVTSVWSSSTSSTRWSTSPRKTAADLMRPHVNQRLTSAPVGSIVVLGVLEEALAVGRRDDRRVVGPAGRAGVRVAAAA